MLQLDEQSSGFTDYFLLCSGSNPRQVQAISDEIDHQLSAAGVEPKHTEGYNQAEWVLIDYVDFVVHIFSENARKFYDLERLWKTATAHRPADLDEPARRRRLKRVAAKSHQAGEEDCAKKRARQAQELLRRELHIAWIGRHQEHSHPIADGGIPEAAAPFAACDAHELASEAALLKLLEKSGRTQPVLVLLTRAASS